LEEGANQEGKGALWETLRDIEQEWRAVNFGSSATSTKPQERTAPIEAALDTLTPDQRDALYLHLGRGMPCAEIARQTNTPRIAVLIDLLRAYSRLRLLLGNDDFGDLFRH
jgi:DNA-directed RNA polymerase specialized sigma24 family protein